MTPTANQVVSVPTWLMLFSRGEEVPILFAGPASDRADLCRRPFFVRNASWAGTSGRDSRPGDAAPRYRGRLTYYNLPGAAAQEQWDESGIFGAKGAEGSPQRRTRQEKFQCCWESSATRMVTCRILAERFGIGELFAHGRNPLRRHRNG